MMPITKIRAIDGLGILEMFPIGTKLLFLVRFDIRKIWVRGSVIRLGFKGIRGRSHLLISYKISGAKKEKWYPVRKLIKDIDEGKCEKVSSPIKNVEKSFRKHPREDPLISYPVGTRVKILDTDWYVVEGSEIGPEGRELKVKSDMGNIRISVPPELVTDYTFVEEKTRERADVIKLANYR